MKCGYQLLWWDGDNEGAYVCVLAAEHLALHTDGTVWFTDRDTVDAPEAAVVPGRSEP